MSHCQDGDSGAVNDVIMYHLWVYMEVKTETVMKYCCKIIGCEYYMDDSYVSYVIFFNFHSVLMQQQTSHFISQSFCEPLVGGFLSFS